MSLVAMIHWLSVLAAAGWAADPADPADDPPLAAVDGRPILESRVRWRIDSVLRGRAADPDALQRLRREAVELLASRRVVLDYLQAQGLAAQPQEAELALQRLGEGLAARQEQLDDRLAEQGLNREIWIEDYIWRESWSRYLKRFLTPENINRYFLEHRREFDGTKLRVAQILIAADPARQEAFQAAEKRAREVAAQLGSGEVQFADAARRWSDAPSGAQGGELGWIERRQPMPPGFSEAAFALQDVGQISPPVASPFGWHLIQLLEVEPGDKTLKDVETEVRSAVSEYVFQWLSDRERPKHTITFGK